MGVLHVKELGLILVDKISNQNNLICREKTFENLLLPNKTRVIVFLLV